MAKVPSRASSSTPPSRPLPTVVAAPLVSNVRHARWTQFGAPAMFARQGSASGMRLLVALTTPPTPFSTMPTRLTSRPRTTGHGGELIGDDRQGPEHGGIGWRRRLHAADA